jgi:hypothetical protein
MMEEKKVFEKLTKLQDCLMQKFSLEERLKSFRRLEDQAGSLGEDHKEYTDETDKGQAAKDELKSYGTIMT